MRRRWILAAWVSFAALLVVAWIARPEPIRVTVERTGFNLIRVNDHLEIDRDEVLQLKNWLYGQGFDSDGMHLDGQTFRRHKGNRFLAQTDIVSFTYFADPDNHRLKINFSH